MAEAENLPRLRESARRLPSPAGNRTAGRGRREQRPQMRRWMLAPPAAGADYSSDRRDARWSGAGERRPGDREGGPRGIGALVRGAADTVARAGLRRSEEHTSELQT